MAARGGRIIVHTPDAPKAIGPYSQAIATERMVFTSGQIGLDPATGEIVEGGVASQARQVLINLTHVLQAAETSLAAVVKTTVYLKDMGDFAAMNEVYGEFFADEPPSRSTVAVAGLPKGALVEIDAIAVIPTKDS